MDKDHIEQMCRRAGMKPATRLSVKGVDIFIADGFSAPPHVNFRRLGIMDTDYPMGCYVTLWWASRQEEKLDVGQPLFFEPFHDQDHDRSFRPQMRVNAAIQAAAKFLERRRQHANG